MIVTIMFMIKEQRYKEDNIFNQVETKIFCLLNQNLQYLLYDLTCWKIHLIESGLLLQSSSDLRISQKFS